MLEESPSCLEMDTTKKPQASSIDERPRPPIKLKINLKRVSLEAHRTAAAVFDNDEDDETMQDAKATSDVSEKRRRD